MTGPPPAKTRLEHFDGSAGEGRSALAELFVRRGYTVTGCDTNIGAVGDLKRIGIEVIQGHDPSHVEGASEIVVTSAVRKDHNDCDDNAGSRVSRARSHGYRWWTRRRVERKPE